MSSILPYFPLHLCGICAKISLSNIVLSMGKQNWEKKNKEN
jgi:hypothetical protein